jgi:hypothetical protein
MDGPTVAQDRPLGRAIFVTTQQTSVITPPLSATKGSPRGLPLFKGADH